MMTNAASESNDHRQFEHECRIRDFYAKRLGEQRPDERLIGTEQWYQGARARADMRTVDKYNQLREWEFKIRAGYEALGQILTYVALARRRVEFARPIKGVIAAFEFQEEVREAVEVMNLGIELVTIPPWMARAGGVPLARDVATPTVEIPRNPVSDADIRSGTGA